MTTQYTSILKLALPVQGELSGTWGDVVNDNITSMVEQAIAGRAVINTWTANAHTLTSANGTTSESRCAMLELTDTGTALSGAGSVVCPTASKIYIVKNAAGQNITVKTASGTGVLVPNGRTTFLFCDGTNVVEALTHTTSLQLGTSTTVTAVLDEDNMASNSATSLATQQSIKAYVDSKVSDFDSLAEVLAVGNTTGSNNIVVDNGQKITTNTIDETTAGSGVTIDSVLLKDDVVNATDIETGSISANDGTAAATIANSTGVITVPSAVLTTADINGGTADGVVIGGATPAAATVTTATANTNLTIAGTVTVTSILDEDNMASNSATSLATQQSIKAYVDAQVGTVDTLAEVLGNGNTTGGNDIVFSAGDNITNASGDLTIDVAGDIILDADDGIVNFKDGGTSYGLVAKSGNNLIVKSQISDGDFVIRGNDGGSEIDAITIDMSEGGNAGLGVSPTTSYGNVLQIHDTGTSGANLRLTDSTSGAGTGNGFEIIQIGADDYIMNRENGFIATYTNNTERLRIGSDGNVAIGNSSTASAKTLISLTGTAVTGDTDGATIGASGIVNLHNGNSGTNSTVMLLGTTNASVIGQIASGIGFSRESSGDWGTQLRFYTHSTSTSDLDELNEAMRINSSGNVGVGVTTIQGSVNGKTLETSGCLVVGGNLAAHQTNRGVFEYQGNVFQMRAYGASAGQGEIAFRTGGGGGGADSEAVRIDSSGNLLVGTTNANPTGADVVGASIDASGEGNFSVDGAEALRLNRKSSDGEILNLRKDGGTVGSIATFASEIAIGSNDAFLWTSGNNNAFLPASTSTGGASNGLLDLGSSGRNFKDLHLSGTGNVGNLTLTGGGVIGSNGTSDTLVLTGSNAEHSGAGITLHGNTHASASVTLFKAGSSEIMRIQSGKVSINTSSALSTLHVRDSGANSGSLRVGGNGASLGLELLYDQAAATESIIQANPSYTSTSQLLKIRSDGDLNTNQLVLDGAGNVMVGGTNGNPVGNHVSQVIMHPTNGTGIHRDGGTPFKLGTDGNRAILIFHINGADVGSIDVSGSTTAYNESSDHRLKTDVQSMTGATDRLKQLNPVNFEWIIDGTRADGFLAHEVQSIVPQAITGEKDAVDADGNPEYQGIDQSKLVPLLVKTIQELEARITALEGV